MPLPLSRSAVICLKHRRGGSPDPPAGFGTGFIPRGGFRPLGEFLSQRWERNQRIAGGDSHRRRKQVPSGSSSFSPSPPFTGDTPIRFRRRFGAQNTVPDLDFSGPLGPGAVGSGRGWGSPPAPPGVQPTLQGGGGGYHSLNHRETCVPRCQRRALKGRNHHAGKPTQAAAAVREEKSIPIPPAPLGKPQEEPNWRPP